MLLRDWKILSFLRLIALLILSLSILSCGQNILGPENIPPPTDFYIPPDTIPGNVDIKPIPAPDGTVFGGFGKRFIYKGKWHVLVDNIYKYNPDTKTLTKRSSKSLIRPDDEEKVSIIVENMGYNLWNFYNSDDLVIEENRIWQADYRSDLFPQPPSYDANYLNAIANNYNENAGIYYSDRIETWYQYYYTEDLVNIKNSPSSYPQIPNSPYKEEILMTIPKPILLGGPSDSWNRKFGIFVSIKFFKDYYYAFGGNRRREENPLDHSSPTEKTYKRIHKNKNGRVSSNWEIIEPPWKPRTWLAGDGNLESRLSKDGERFFIGYGVRYGYAYDSIEERYTDIWSTTDGINWREENSKADFNEAYPYSYSVFNYYDDVRHKFVAMIPPTPLEPDWAKSTKNSYYKMDNIRNSIPVPYSEIRAAADRGETNFVVTDEHKNSYNNFLISSKHPDKAEQKDWKALKINNYTKSSMHWVSSPEYLFAFGDKLIRFVDYDKIGSYYNNMASKEKYDSLMKNHKIWHKRGEAGGYTSEWGWETSQRDCYINSMNYKAQADVMSAVLHGDIKDVYPDEAVSHYILEFYH